MWVVPYHEPHKRRKEVNASSLCFLARDSVTSHFLLLLLDVLAMTDCVPRNCNPE